MKVKDLIKALQNLDEDADVMVLQAVSNSQHYTDSGEPEYEFSDQFKLRKISDKWVELV